MPWWSYPSLAAAQRCRGMLALTDERRSASGEKISVASPRLTQ
jgi:hypothetical protein